MLMAASSNIKAGKGVKADFSQVSCKGVKALSHKRLTPCDAEFFHPLLVKHLGNQGQLLNGEDMAVVLFAHAVLSHTIFAPKVAKVGDGQTQIFNFSAVGV